MARWSHRPEMTSNGNISHLMHISPVSFVRFMFASRGWPADIFSDSFAGSLAALRNRGRDPAARHGGGCLAIVPTALIKVRLCNEECLPTNVRANRWPPYSESQTTISAEARNTNRYGTAADRTGNNSDAYRSPLHVVFEIAMISSSSRG